MDPVANLNRQREIVRAILAIWDECPEDGEFTDEQLQELGNLAPELAELVQALDEWRLRGGFDPYAT